jgi:DNA-binding MarR family transcriptional regulator
MDLQRGPITTAHKLMRAFMLFGRAAWHERTVAGYKPSEIQVLFCIRGKRWANPPVTRLKVSEISKAMHVTSPTVTQLLKGLEANGLIERHNDPADRRSVAISLTPKGEAVTQEAAEDFTSSMNGLIEYLGEEQSEELASLLFKVFNYYRERTIAAGEASWQGFERDLSHPGAEVR